MDLSLLHVLTKSRVVKGGVLEIMEPKPINEGITKPK
jgi:hypothetical protein